MSLPLLTGQVYHADYDTYEHYQAKLLYADNMDLVCERRMVTKRRKRQDLIGLITVTETVYRCWYVDSRTNQYIGEMEDENISKIYYEQLSRISQPFSRYGYGND